VSKDKVGLEMSRNIFHILYLGISRLPRIRGASDAGCMSEYGIGSLFYFALKVPNMIARCEAPGIDITMDQALKVRNISQLD
jgi:hypothetical protein